MQVLASEANETPDSVDRKVLLNLGCGANVHSAFINIDLIPGPGVMVHDLRKGIPFRDSACDVVYQSNMLSHLRPADALGLMRECRRVLKPGGVLRVVTEDLEQMCRVYLEKLESAWGDDPYGVHDHEWMILEMYDQATRERSGGAMRDFLNKDPLPNKSFICSRIGDQWRTMVSRAHARAVSAEESGVRQRSRERSFLRRAREKAKRVILTGLLGAAGIDAIEIGRFRLLSGQISYRMYDRFSLRELFRAAGFSNISQKRPSESGHPLWTEVNLDILPNGKAASPHSLIMEAE